MEKGLRGVGKTGALVLGREKRGGINNILLLDWRRINFCFDKVVLAFCTGCNRSHIDSARIRGNGKTYYV